MHDLLKASRLRKGAGEKLPNVWRAFEEAGIHIRRGQLTLIASAPGVGKSALILAYAVKARVPALYISMDTDAHTTAIRVGQMVSMYEADRTEALLADDEFRTEVLGQTPHLKFSFRSSLTFHDLSKVVAAYATAHGEYPQLLIVDNLANVAFEGDEFAELRRIMGDLHQLARLTQSAVVALHHVTGVYENGDEHVPLSGLQGKISKMPELILTMFRGPQINQMLVSTVKNRHGKADPSGRWQVELSAYLPTMQIGDKEVVSVHRGSYS